jgi:hypothetical protein
MSDQESPILCPNCAAGYAWRYDAGNKRVTCKCGAIFRVPLNSFSACELITKPGEPLPAPADAEFAIQEDPVESVGFLKEVSLEPIADEDLLTENETSPAAPPSTTTPSPAKPIPKRPQIIPFADSIPSPVQAPRAPQHQIDIPAPEPSPQPALTEKPSTPADKPLAAKDTPAPDPRPRSLQILCPHCQSALPGNTPVDIGPHCKSHITPLRDNNVEADVARNLDSPIMATLRKRGLEQVVQTVAREAAERKALERKYAFERSIFDVWLPTICAGIALLFILIVTALNLGRFPLAHMIAHHLVWILFIMAPASLATIIVGQYTLDADFHLDRVLFTKLASVVLFPYAIGMLVAPGAFDLTDLFPYVCLLIITIGGFMAILGTVYRLTIGQAALMTGAYGMTILLLSSMLTTKLIQTFAWLITKFFHA